jgi:hypothetical protein
MMPEENRPPAPELARRMTLSSCQHDPVRAFAPVLTAMPEQGIPHDRGPKGTHHGAVIANGNLYCPTD